MMSNNETMPTTNPVMKSDLSPGRRWLVERMQAIYFGRLEHLTIHNGEPVPDRLCAVERVLRIAGPNAVPPQLVERDFVLRQEVLALLAFLDQFANGVIEAIAIRNGLPCEIVVKEVAA